MGLPRLDNSAVTRPRLLSRFENLPALMLVRGPMGSGKTTLVAQWATAERDAGRQLLWLDGVVDSPETVVRTLADHLGFALPESGGLAVGLTAMTSALRQLDDRLVVVIDGFDPVADVLGAPLMAVLERCRHLHLVLCVRDRHDFVWQAAAGSGVEVIATDDLALTREELVAYAAQRGVVISADTVSSVIEATSGVASLIRTGLQGRPSGMSGGGQGWWSWNDVRDLIRDQIRRVLGSEAVAEVFALSFLTDASLDVVRSALPTTHRRIVTLLHQVGSIERRGESDQLFVRLPPVVAEVLRSLHDPARDAELAALHDGVIAELERSGRLLDAVELARKARRHDALLNLIKLHWWDIAAQDVGALAGALEALPDDMLARRSVLMRHLSELIPDRVTTEPIAEIEEVSGDDQELRAVAAGPDARTYLDGVMIGLMAARFRGDRDRAQEQVRRGMLMVSVMSQYSQHQLPVGIRRFFVQAGLVHLLEMDLPSAELAFRRGYGSDRQDTGDVLRREAANKLALVHALKGDHRGTHAWLDRAAAIEPPTGWLAPMIESPRQLAEAILAMDRFDQREVDRLLAELAATNSTDELWFMESAVRAAASLLWGGIHLALHAIQLNRVDHAHLLGEGTLAQSCLVAWEGALQIGLGHGTEAEVVLTSQPQSLAVKVVRARLLVLSGRTHEALAVLAAVTHTSHDLSRTRVEALLLTAQAFRGLGEMDLARAYLGKAARHPEFISTFALVPRSLISDNVGTVPELAAILGELEAADATPPFREVLDVVRLTKREQRLVELLSTSQSRASIASGLFVSTNTVKTQLQTLYRKLEVTSREEAVARAYELGLLS